MLSEDYLLEKCKILLGIDDTDMYDARLDLLIGGAINKLDIEGVPNSFELKDGEATPLIKDYLVCISYQLALDLNLDVDLQTFYVQYLTRVNQLRCSLNPQQS